jgi:hypothetical protein
VNDLTVQEQERVRLAIRFVRLKIGAAAFARAVKSNPLTVRRVLGGGEVGASLAFRVARLAGVSIGDLLAGAFPPAGTCPKCGYAS